MSEYSTPERPEISGQQHYVGAQKILCALAIVLCGAYAWSRGLNWSDLEIVVKGKASPGLEGVAKSVPMSGESWDAFDRPMWMCGFAVLLANGVYLCFSRVTDQLVPAIANTAIGFVLVTVTSYFIADPNGARNTASESEHLIFTNKVASGVYVSLAIALALMAVGLAQIVVRSKAEAATVAARAG